MKTDTKLTLKKRPKFIFVIDEKLLHEIKVRAAVRNISMGQWVTRAILEQMLLERKYEEKDKE